METVTNFKIDLNRYKVCVVYDLMTIWSSNAFVEVASNSNGLHSQSCWFIPELCARSPRTHTTKLCEWQTARWRWSFGKTPASREEFSPTRIAFRWVDEIGVRSCFLYIYIFENRLLRAPSCAFPVLSFVVFGGRIHRWQTITVPTLFSGVLSSFRVGWLIEETNSFIHDFWLSLRWHIRSVNWILTVLH